MTLIDTLTAALRAVLPLALVQADQLRESANDEEGDADEADEATHAITAARLALQDAHAAAHHLSHHVRYRVTLHVALIGFPRVPHTVNVMAECADDAQAAAIAACEAAGLIHGDVLRIARVTA